MTDTAPEVDDPAADDDAAPSYDPLAALTVDELHDGSRVLKASIVQAVTRVTADYERALAVVLWLHARRTDPRAKLATYTALTFTEASEQLGELAAVDDRPTTPTPSPA